MILYAVLRGRINVLNTTPLERHFQRQSLSARSYLPNKFGPVGPAILNLEELNFPSQSRGACEVVDCLNSQVALILVPSERLEARFA